MVNINYLCMLVIMRTLRKIFKIWLDNMAEFYKPLIENNIQIIM